MRALALIPALLALALLVLAPRAHAYMPPGMISKRSPYDVGQTLDRLEDLLKKNGFTVIARIDDQAIAKAGGQIVAPIQSLIVSLPGFDAALIESERATGLEVPMRILCWQDSNGSVNLTYPSPDQLAQRYNVTSQPVPVQHMDDLLGSLTDQAVKP